jgi:hypothetical protein
MAFPVLLVLVLLFLVFMFAFGQRIGLDRRGYGTWITVVGLAVIALLVYFIFVRGWS